jgi:hypothetical protein
MIKHYLRDVSFLSLSNIIIMLCCITFCDSSAMSPEKLKKNNRERRPFTRRNGNYSCKFCGERLPTSRMLWNHENEKESPRDPLDPKEKVIKKQEDGLYHCGVCGKGFSGFKERWYHTKYRCSNLNNKCQRAELEKNYNNNCYNNHYDDKEFPLKFPWEKEGNRDQTLLGSIREDNDILLKYLPKYKKPPLKKQKHKK